MNGKFFLDTNILVYCFDSSAPAKKRVADQFIAEALRHQNGVISYQVIQEFLNVATRKFATPMNMTDATRYLNDVLVPLCEVYSSQKLYDHALRIQFRFKLSFYDSLVVAAAHQAECEVLYSEDLHPGLQVEHVVVKNPFSK
jgi:predicted nucleic acid-binding protein